MRILSILSLAAGLACAGTVEIQNRKECYSLPPSGVADCLSAIRSGRTYVGEGRAPSVNATVDSEKVESRASAPKSLEERSVIAQESAVRAQQGIANALWVQTGLIVVGIIATIIATK